MDSNINDDMARFDHNQSKIDVLEEGEVWKPNEIRDFEIFIYQSDSWNSSISVKRNLREHQNNFILHLNITP